MRGQDRRGQAAKEKGQAAREKAAKRILKRKQAGFLTALLALLCVLGIILSRSAVPGAGSGAGEGDRAAGEGLKAHFLDVGQADCTLIESDGHFMLVDAGNNEDAGVIIPYLKALSVRKLDYVIGTHPHEDHIGALDAVIERFDVGEVLIPDKDYDSASYLDVLKTVGRKGLTVTHPEPGEEYALGKAAFTVVAPVGEYEDLNNSSMGIRLTDGQNVFLLCGDAESEAERDMCSSGQDLSADVYQVNHHGSNSSSTAEFLRAVSPRYAVISCGRDNDYGYPANKVLKRFSSMGIYVYRTDEMGTVTASCVGGEIRFQSEGVADGTGKKNSPGQSDSREGYEPAYLLNRKTMKFHRPDCPGAADIRPDNYGESDAARGELIDMGYEPCGTCKP